MMTEAIYRYIYATRGGGQGGGRANGLIPQEGQREKKSKKKIKSGRL